MSDVLDIRDVSVRYPGGVEALRDVSLRVGRGERVAVIGPNGGGKTTLLLAIMRGAPFTGRITVDGVESARRTAHEVRARCGMVFQEADDQLFMPTLLDDAAFGPLNQGLDAPDAEARAREALADVGLDALADRAGHHLSGGQKRSAALATVLAMRVRLLLLDEPGANLDARSRRRLIDLLAGREEAMLLATHDLDMVRTLCGRAIVLDEARVAADGPVEAILDDRRLLEEHGLI